MSKTQTRFLTAQLMQFITGAVPRGTLQLTSLAGEESISRPYEYRLELAARDKDLDLDALLREKAHISIRQGVKLPGDELGARVLRVHGVLRSFVQVGRELEWVKYRAVLVPTLWRLSLGRASRVFQGRRIPEIVQEVAEAYGVRVDLGKLKLGNFKQREYVVQYEESDLDFIHRWLEREGIYYYFEQTEDGERMVLGHSSEAYGKLLGDATFRFKPLPEHKNVEAVDSDAASDDWFAEETVNELVAETRPLPRRVVLNDYNWRNPGANLRIEETVSEDGAGDVYLYNQHYETESEGRALAKLRAQELICRRIEFTGRGECRGFRAGHTFTLDEHFRAGFNQEYLLVQVRHTASQGLSLGSGNQGGASYRNEFTAIPASCEYRPPSVTKWPQISGFMHARVDGPDTGTPYAQHDANGQYRVRMPLDLGDAADGAASRPVRKGEAYAGPGQGMHFPLLRGSEVMMSHIDGDPDRPVIACAVYNNDTPSVSTADNATQNVIKTPIGSRIVMDDTEGTHYIRIHTADEKNRINLDATDGAEAVTIRSTVSNSTIRLGKSQGEATPAAITNADGLHFSADGDVNIVARTNVNSHAGMDANGYVGGVRTETVVKDYNLTVNGNQATVVQGNRSWLTMGWDDFKFHAGIKTNVVLGKDIKLVSGSKLDTVGGFDSKWVRGVKTEFIQGAKVTIGECESHEFFKKKKEVKTADSWSAEALKNCSISAKQGSVTVKAKTMLTLKCGQSKLVLKADGNMYLGNDHSGIFIEKSGDIELASAKVMRINGTTVYMKGKRGGSYIQ